MKVLQLGKFYPPVFGGIQSVMFELTTGLNNNGIECDVLCSNINREYIMSQLEGYKVYRTSSYGIYFSTSISPQMVLKLKEIQNNYDIISIHFPDPMAVLALFLTRPKAKIVLHWHSDIVKQKFLLNLFKPLQNWIINRADLILGATEKHIYESDNASQMIQKCKILPYPFDLHAFVNRGDDNLFNILTKKYKNKKIIFAMGRLIYYKGFEYLIEAAKYLNDEYLVLIGGEGNLQEKFEKEIKSNDLEHKVKLIGFIPYHELPTYYKICDLFCLPSMVRSEMFGIVQLEAMSFGKPIITSKLKRSGVCHVNIDGVTGKCLDFNNPIEIANVITLILEDSEKYSEYSENCIKRVKEVYDKEKIIKSLIKIYKEVLINGNKL